MTNDEDQKRLVTDNETLKQKYKVLQHECQVNQQEIVGRKRIRVTKFRSQLKLQAEFISKLGFMFAYYLFKVTQNQEFIDKMMYRQDDLEKLSRTMIGVLTTFDDAYGYSNTPIVDTYETRFILGIVGVVANLSTTEKGRRYYSTMNSGKTIMCIILKIVHRLPSPSGNSLKKMSYSALYNVSIYSVLSTMFIVPELIGALNEDIKDVCTTPELSLFALKLIYSLLKNACTSNAYYIMKNNIEQSQLIILASSTDVEMENIARNILDDFRKAKEHFESKIIST